MNDTTAHRPGGVNSEELVAAARETVTVYTAAEAIEAYRERGDIVLVDVRDAPEGWEHGTVPGAVQASRGMLEFHIDPESPVHMDEFERDDEFVFFCAVGPRSTLAARTAQEMGIERVATVDGGFNAWSAAGGPMDEPKPRMA